MKAATKKYSQTLSHISSVWSRITDILVDYGKGAYLYDINGNRYLDFTSGIGVTNTGHCHPKVVDAVKTQAGKLLFGQLNILYHRPFLDLINELRTIVPEKLDTFFFSNSGAEAVEASIKLAKHATGKPNIIVFQGSFHGRTHLTMAMTTSKTTYRKKYQPLVPGIFVAPYPYPFYYGWDEEKTLDFSLRELKRLLKSQTAPEETACMIVEPILGEGGYVVPPRGFLTALRELCDYYDILLIADEIQTAFGRTGAFFAVEHESVVPDIITMAKGIASGMPLSGIAFNSALSDKWITGSHGGTYGGNPVSCAAAVATIKAIKEENLIENARARGEQLLGSLKKLQRDFPVISEVRGKGLMVATEFYKNGHPDPELTKAVKKNCERGGLLLLTCGTEENVIRWIPPLIVKENQITEAVDIFKRALSSAIS